jgi:hypothetical protein
MGPKRNAYCALVEPRSWTCGFISRADVADFLVKHGEQYLRSATRHRAASKKKRIADPTKRCNITGE